MSYLVLARKYRPQSFDFVIGQEHISELLKKAIEGGRIAHAYLFCGPRGIGKTSCARIFAKSLNCAQGPTLNPCGKCASCQEITNGNSFDVLEIDGASNRGIDEIRALRENVKFAPSYGRFKIYIVDEVHMLTTEAFNALLKTLEEPPAHAKFIFATTAPNKVPSTILSRCQRFDFKRISIKTMVDALGAIVKKENVEIDSGALYAIAKAAEGSLRDALSILDQLSAISDRKIATEDVTSMLGLVETQLLFDLADAISQKNCVAALTILEKTIEEGKDVKQLTKDITAHFRHLMVIKVGGKTLGKLVDYPAEIKDMLLAQSQQFSLRDILLALDIFIQTQEISRITESLQMPLEIALAKLTYCAETPSPKAPAAAPKTAAANPLETRMNQPASSILKSQKGHIDVAPLENDPEANPLEAPPSEGSIVSAEDLSAAKIKQVWDNLTYAVSREKMSVATFLQEGHPHEFKNGRLTISFSSKCKFQKEALEGQTNIKLVEKILSQKLGTSILVHYILMDEDPAKDEDPAVKSVLNEFKGTVVNRWHNDGDS